MTLFKQLALLTTFFLGLILVTVLFLNFKSSQAFIQNQLLSNAEDTAASLALSLGGVVKEEPLDEGDEMGLDALDDSMSTVEKSSELKLSDSLKSTLETMVNAIYDRGYYESITLEDFNKKVLIRRSVVVKVPEVPTWFVNTIDLGVNSAISEVNGAYGSKFGRLIVKSNVGNGYVQLWDVFTDLLKTFLILAVLFFIALALLLRIILRSLKDIEGQAKAIQDHDFITLDNIPFTLEFRHVVGAMNQMVIKVKEIFDKEAQSLKKYHELLYTDGETKLFNRRYLSMKLDTHLSEGSTTSHGSFAMISLDGYEESKKRVGYLQIQKMLHKLATHFSKTVEMAPEGLAVRMNEDDFALLVPGIKIHDAKVHYDTMIEQIKIDINSFELSHDLCVNVGVIDYKVEDTPKTLFARADFELSKSKIKQQTNIVYAKEEVYNTLVLGKEEWINTINASLEENMLKVASQKVVNVDTQEILHQEMYLRLMDTTGKVYNAGYFMPVLVNLNLTDAVDRHVIALSMHHAKTLSNIASMAINISAQFLKVPENLQWLRESILDFSKTSDVKLSFEASNFNVLKNIELFTQFSHMLKPRNYAFGIDNFSITEDGLEYLQGVKPSYIKANKSFFFDLNDDQNSSANDSLRILTSSLGIEMVATAVETNEELQKLKKIKLQYVQGSAIQEPTILGV